MSVFDVVNRFTPDARMIYDQAREVAHSHFVIDSSFVVLAARKSQMLEGVGVGYTSLIYIDHMVLRRVIGETFASTDVPPSVDLYTAAAVRMLEGAAYLADNSDQSDGRTISPVNAFHLLASAVESGSAAIDQTMRLCGTVPARVAEALSHYARTFSVPA